MDGLFQKSCQIPNFTLIIKPNSRQIIDLNVNGKPLNLLADTISSSNFRVGEGFFSRSQKAGILKEKMDKLEFIKVKNF